MRDPEQSRIAQRVIEGGALRVDLCHCEVCWENADADDAARLRAEEDRVLRELEEILGEELKLAAANLVRHGVLRRLLFSALRRRATRENS